MANPLVRTHDGVGVLIRGNLVLVVYDADARLHRTKWLFDRVDELIASSKERILILLVISETAGPPDGPTRAENTRRFKKIDGAVIRMVTVAQGDAFQMSIVRTIMRTMLLLLRQSARHVVVGTVAEGIAQIQKEAGPNTPKKIQIELDLRDVRADLPLKSRVGTQPHA